MSLSETSTNHIQKAPHNDTHKPSKSQNIKRKDFVTSFDSSDKITSKKNYEPSSFAVALTHEKSFGSSKISHYKSRLYTHPVNSSIHPFDFLDPSPDDVVQRHQKSAFRNKNNVSAYRPNTDKKKDSDLGGNRATGKKQKGGTVDKGVSSNPVTEENRKKMSQMSLASGESSSPNPTPKKTHLSTPNKFISR